MDNTPQGGTKKSTPQGGIELNGRFSGALSSVPSSGIEKNAPLRGKALKRKKKMRRKYLETTEKKSEAVKTESKPTCSIETFLVTGKR
ncbi:MAG: hypothetical protein GY799_04805 [Desulfobulbaceae bacterium]|nr:hypothetical protein [Desulfobulbaceae bacterium]